MATTTTKIKFSFAPGLEKIALGSQKDIKERLHVLLGTKNRYDFCRKKNGIVNIDKPLYDSITELFSEYGVTEDDVWATTNV